MTTNNKNKNKNKNKIKNRNIYSLLHNIDHCLNTNLKDKVEKNRKKNRISIWTTKNNI